MWSREHIKTYAKDFLRKYYWKAFLVCLIAFILSGGSGSNSGRSSNQNQNRNNYNQNQVNININNKVPIEINSPVLNYTIRKLDRSPIVYIARGALPVVFLIFIILMITVGYAIEVGKVRFFLMGFKEDVNVRNLFSTFNSNEYFGIVKVQFVRGFYNFLWFLLLIIPGIIKSYEYSMVPYILSEEPNLSPDEAITRSRHMTEGHKMDMFILDISFWGWYILGSLFFGIGGIFVNPYKEATMAKLYNILSGNDSMDNDIILE